VKLTPIKTAEHRQRCLRGVQTVHDVAWQKQEHLFVRRYPAGNIIDHPMAMTCQDGQQSPHKGMVESHRQILRRHNIAPRRAGKEIPADGCLQDCPRALNPVATPAQ